MAGLAASGGSSTRLRLGLRAEWERTLPSGAMLRPHLEVGLRHDGGDAETGTGVEIGGGITWDDPAFGLRITLDGRALATHDAGGFRNRGVSLRIAWDPRPETKRGCSVVSERSIGGASSGSVDALLGPETFPGLGEADGGGGWSVEAACGTGHGRGMVGSPYARAGGGGGTDSVRVGYRIEPDTEHAENATVQAWAEPTADGGAAVGTGFEWRW